MFRFIGGTAIGYYALPYFEGQFETHKSDTAVIYALIVAVGGFISNFGGAFISDHFEEKNFMTKAYVCIIGSFFGAIFIMGAMMFTHNYPLTMTSMALEYIFAESWGAPVIAMILNTISNDNKGFAVAAYITCCTITGTITAQIVAPIQTWAKGPDDKNPVFENSGLVIMAFVLFSYIGSIPFFYLAGRNYKAYKENLRREEAEEAARE